MLGLFRSITAGRATPGRSGDVAFAKILGFEAAAVTPRFVLQNVPAEAYKDVLAGVFYGWLNRNAALGVQTRHGKGAMLLTTFRFQQYATDAYSRRLLDAMIAYAAGTGFNPKFDWDANQDKKNLQKL